MRFLSPLLILPILTSILFSLYFGSIHLNNTYPRVPPAPIISFEGRRDEDEHNDRGNPVISFGGRRDDNNATKPKGNRGENKYRGRIKNLQSELPFDEEKIQTIDNFFMHIPKTAGSTARNTINKILRKPVSEAKNLFRHTIPDCGKQIQLLCDHGTDSYYQYKTWNQMIPIKQNPCKGDLAKCIMHMAESEYPSGMQTNVYTILRPPHEHVLSQFFHCTESKNRWGEYRHKQNENITLDEWLNAWVSYMESDIPPHAPQIEINEGGKRAKQPGLARAHVHSLFKCYNPINFQSFFLQFNKTLTPEDSKMDLKQRFDVIGLTTQFDKSICLIIIHLIGKVPMDCDCSTSKRRLRRITHGVKHHGATFQTTERQMHAINYLTQVDKRVFRYAEEIFEEKVISIEKKYSFKMCNSLGLD